MHHSYTPPQIDVELIGIGLDNIDFLSYGFIMYFVNLMLHVWIISQNILDLVIFFMILVC